MSKLIEKILEPDARRRMPPRKFNKELSPRDIALLKLWIQQGAKWEGHWSFIAAKRPEVPPITVDKYKDWPVNAIDRFVLRQIERHGLEPSPEADRRTLLRRLSFDLTGLPPTPEETDAFVNDKSPEAYEKAVDRLLVSKAFGERMALYWLDVVRYADTGGYHSDNHRDIWMYRDYVIDAFNKNKPFDRFLTEQLAGDLLPDATLEQKVASGFNRLLQTTEEGGAQPKEYAAKYAADRVRNTASIFLGATMGCAECHDHKFDPYTQKDFYSFASFFADLQEKAVGRQAQTPILTPEQQAKLDGLDAELAKLKKDLDKPRPGLADGQLKWEEALRAELAKNPKPKKGGPPANVLKAVQVPADKRSDADKKLLAQFYNTVAPELAPLRKQIAEVEKDRQEVTKAVPSTLVSISGNPRTMRILPRGNWLDDSGQIVQPAVPEALPALTVKDRRGNRLDLASWMIAADNPVVSRVFVNRLWKLYFGKGIVKTLDDFGSQGAWPTHPELLDWLAVEFRDSGWNIKHMIKLMVLSRTYRQASFVSEKAGQIDPFNDWLARQARYRLDAEAVRDNALAISGLLSRTLGGPSVKPYQPEGYWQHLNFPKRSWVKDKGEDLYRRGLYTYWQRTFLHPSLLAFDAPSREECTVERPRSNTPLQALVLLNDPTYVEAARVFASHIVQGAKSTEDRLDYAFRRALCRKPAAAETKLLTTLYEQHLKQFQSDAAAVDALLKVGDAPVPQALDRAELAAWTSVARVILNLHETITRN
ncbi:MAG: DUF1549 and DUF1553 domain-containing protein [Gemmataceae bacterium]